MPLTVIDEIVRFINVLVLMRADVITQVLVVLEKRLSCGHITSSFAGIQLFFDIGDPRQLFNCQFIH